MVRKKDKPKFTVRNWGLRKRVRVRNRWRRPRADSNKMKGKLAFAGASPRIGYKNSPEVRNLHPCGLPEVLVFSPQDLEGISNCIARIGSAVGARKAAEIEKAAKAAGLRIANPRKMKEKKQEKEKKEKKKELKPKEEVSKIASPAVKEEKKEKKEETKAKPKEEKKPETKKEEKKVEKKELKPEEEVEAKPKEEKKPKEAKPEPETGNSKPKGDVS